LTEALRVQRAHALLVHGPQGVGQFEFALALAAAWLCETLEADRPEGRACGHCASCRLVAARSHPDLRLVVPEALRAEAGLAGDEASTDDEGKKRKPSREIKVDQIRSALDFSELTAGRARFKVVVLHPAEQVNDVAANALLKTLEEPPGALRFVLSCGAPQALLPTIRSRCQSVRLGLPPHELAVAWLAGQGVPDAEVVLDACGGQPLAALDLTRAGLDAAAWRDFPHWVAQGRAAAVVAWPLPVLVAALQKLCHDQLLLRVGAPPRYFKALSLPAGADLVRLTAWAAQLRRMAAQADHPWHMGLTVESLMLQARQAGAGTAQPIHSRA
jgi:DNA polymerase-3 subunit delta'